MVQFNPLFNPFLGEWTGTYYFEYLLPARTTYRTKRDVNKQINRSDLKNFKLDLIIEELRAAILCQKIVLNKCDTDNEALHNIIVILDKAKNQPENIELQNQAYAIINWYDDKGGKALGELCSRVYLDKNTTIQPMMPKKAHQNIIRRNLGEFVSYAAILTSSVIFSAGIIAIAVGALAPWGIMFAGSSLIIAAALLATASLILTTIVSIKIYLNECQLDEKKATYNLDTKAYRIFLTARKRCEGIIADLDNIIFNRPQEQDQNQDQNSSPSPTHISGNPKFFVPSSINQNQSTSSAASSNDYDLSQFSHYQ